MANKIINLLKKDVLAIVWIIFIATIIIMTFYFQTYIKDFIIISMLFILFFVAEKYIIEAKWISNAPRWKRFPIFFTGIVAIYFGYVFLQEVLTRALPSGGINIVFVGLWLILLFLMYNYKILLD